MSQTYSVEPPELAPSDVKSNTTENESIQPTVTSSTPAPVPSAGVAAPTITANPASKATGPPSPSRRTPAAAAVAATVISGSSRAAKSKKKKGSGSGAGGALGAGENTGRWTAEEHRLFLQGLEQHGKGWKKIASLIKSRTVVQIRTHAQKYFQKLAKARQNGEEGDVSMEGRGGISTLTSATAGGGGQSSKRRRQQTGSKRKAIHSVVTSAQREGKRIAAEQEKTGVPNPVPPLPAVSPVLANFVLPETTDPATNENKSSLASATTTSQGTVSGPALEDSIFRFLTPTPVTGSELSLNDVARQAGANPITLPTDQPSAAPTVGGEISPTGVADLYPSWTDGKDPPSWYAKGADVEALLDVADTLDWLADSGDPHETYQPPAMDAPSSEPEVEQAIDADEALPEDQKDGAPAPPEGEPSSGAVEFPEVETGVLPEVGSDVENVDQQLPSIFDGAPEESTEHPIPEEKGLIVPSESAVDLGESASHAAIEEPLFDTPMEEHDFVSTILENESSADLPALDG